MPASARYPGDAGRILPEVRAARGPAIRFDFGNGSENVRDFVGTPHTGSAVEHQGDILNLVDGQAKPAQNALLTMARENPDVTIREVRHLAMPRHHDVRRENVDLKRLGTPNSGAGRRSGSRNSRAVFRSRPILVCAGRQDGHPFPGPVKTYDEAIAVLCRSLDAAKIDGGEKLEGFRQRDRLSRLWRTGCSRKRISRR
jgi:uncharacterized protein